MAEKWIALDGFLSNGTNGPLLVKNHCKWRELTKKNVQNKAGVRLETDSTQLNLRAAFNIVTKA